MRLFLHGVMLGDRQYFGRVSEDASDFGPLAPIDNAKPCTCGSRCRVFNTDGASFCQRCGTKDESLRVSTFTALR